jgi:hypothetical protein
MNVRREPVEGLTEVSDYDRADSRGDDGDDDPEAYRGDAVTAVPDESNEADAAEQAAEVPVDDDEHE